MSNIMIAAIYFPFAAITAIVVLIELTRRLKRRGDYFFMATCVCIACWFSSSIASLFTGSVVLVRILMQIGLIFVGFLTPCMLLFFMKFYKSSSKLPVPLVAAMMAVPSVTAVLALTGHWHGLIVADLDIVSLAPFRDFTIIWGPWFWVHTAFCYVMAFALVAFLMIAHFRKRRFYRLPSTLMAIGVMITLSGNVLTLMQVLPAGIDPTLITASLSLILFNIAIINNSNSNFVRFSRSQIIHYMDEFILVLNDKADIVDHNRPAAQWFAAQKIPLIGASMKDIKAALLKKGKRLDDDCYMILHPHTLVLRLKEHELEDENGDVVGWISVFSDVTQNHFLLERLEAKAKMDSLTGLPNRGAFEGAMKRMNTPASLPLAVIMGDLNGLKYVNDNFGHQYGDVMLQRTAEILEQNCPGGCFVGRIGGDEFVYLLPRTTLEEAQRLTVDISADMARCDDLPFPMSIALGAAVKHEASELIDAVMALADERMYEDKKLVVKLLVRGQSGDVRTS